jgi:AcrR family transcriptional regulator
MPKLDEAPQIHETQKRLLDAAEALVAVHGIAGTSLREVTDLAGVNLALVKYHFGSKNGLIEAMLNRRLEPINNQRIALLDEAKRRHGTDPIPLEEVLEALIRPAVEMGLQNGKEGALFLRVFGRLFAEPATAMIHIHKQMGKMVKLFDAAFEQALPQLDDHEMGWRKMATLGVVQHSLLMLSMIDHLPKLIQIPIKLFKSMPSTDLVVARLVTFSAAGMRAQMPVIR